MSEKSFPIMFNKLLNDYYNLFLNEKDDVQELSFTPKTTTETTQTPDKTEPNNIIEGIKKKTSIETLIQSSDTTSTKTPIQSSDTIKQNIKQIHSTYTEIYNDCIKLIEHYVVNSLPEGEKWSGQVWLTTHYKNSLFVMMKCGDVHTQKMAFLKEIKNKHNLLRVTLDQLKEETKTTGANVEKIQKELDNVKAEKQKLEEQVAEKEAKLNDSCKAAITEIQKAINNSVNGN